MVVSLETWRHDAICMQVTELARIVVGICLYNRAIGRGGAALPAAAATYLPRAGRLLTDIGVHAGEIQERMQR